MTKQLRAIMPIRLTFCRYLQLAGFLFLKPQVIPAKMGIFYIFNLTLKTEQL